MLRPLLVLVPAALLAAPAAAQQHSSSRTHVVLLGTGTPNPDPDRSGPAVAIVVDSSVYIVDAGPLEPSGSFLSKVSKRLFSLLL